MTDVKLEVSVGKKSLDVNSRSLLALHDSFSSATVSRVSDEPNCVCLSLNYREGSLLKPEMEKVYRFLDEKGLTERINVSVFHTMGSRSPAGVSLVGEFDVAVYR